MSTRKTIDELFVKKTFYHRYKDAFGNRIAEPYEKDVKREVQVVTGWLRFGHYLIDGLIIGVINFFVASFFVELGLTHGFFLGVNLGTTHFNLIPQISTILVTASYYAIMEASMQTTIGKLATGTVVINQYAERPETSSIVGRSFARLIPFEAFSCLADRGWHDRLSGTYVVKTEERDALKRLLSAQQGVFISDSEDLLD